MVSPFLDGIFVEKNRRLLTLLPIALLSLTVLKALLILAQSYVMNYVTNRMMSDIRQELFTHLILLPMAFHDRHSSGRLVSQVLNDVAMMSNAVPSMLRRVIQQGVTFAAMMGVAFYQNWQLATLLLVLGPVAFLAASRVGNRLGPLATRSQELSADMSALLQEAFSGIRIVKAYGNERMEMARFQQTQDKVVHTGIEAGFAASLTSPSLELIGVVGIGAIVWYGGYQVISGTMTPGAFFSFLVALTFAYQPIRVMGSANNTIQSSVAAARRVFELLDLETEETGEGQAVPLPSLSRSLEFRDVEFWYDGNKAAALTGINLTIRAGEMIALVGASGAGKSTLVQLVIRLYDPTSGMVLIDGHDIQQATLASLRGQIGVVTQEPLLFDDTIFGNILYGRPGATRTDVMAAARAAAVDEFVARLPKGYDSLIGEKGVRLSGGQRQRVAIARAILRDPRLLVLDEATSSLDSESEQLVQNALARFMKTRTTLVIAHRLSTVVNADRIVVLESGCMVGLGSHRELLSGCGTYQRLYQAQFKDIQV